jgi:pyruvate dehydrogenase E1 component alpha subunit
MAAKVTPIRASESLSDDEALALYKHLVFVRALDERLGQLQRDGKLAFHLSSIGEEAAIVGSVAALRERDRVFHYGREFGGALWRGMPLGAYLSHLFGSAGDVGKGRQMPDSFASRAAGFASASAPIGTQIVHAVGFAWGAKLRRDDVVALACFGEGATSSGDFHNGMNMAGVFKVPVVFFCRNNGWAISLPASRQSASGSFAVKGVAYGVPGVEIDGNDLFAVYATVRAAVLRAARGEGPTLIEAITGPRAAHDGVEGAEPGPADPLARVRRHLEARGAWTVDDESAHAARARAEIDVALVAAMTEPPPPRESMFDDVYAQMPWHLREQRGGASTP